MIFKKKKASPVDVKKCEKILDTMQETLNGAKLNIHELVWTYGQLGYNIGGSLEGQSYDLEALQRLYYENATIGIALMIQGLTIQTWFDNIKGEEEK